MSRQQTPEEEVDAKQQLRTYCAENQITSPFQDLPFEWVDAVSVPQSPPPSLIDAFPSLEPTFEDAPFDAETGLEDYLTTVLSLGNSGDVLVTRTWPKGALEFLTPFQQSEDAFRRFGPINLKKSTLFLPRETLKGERGMEISTDRSEFDAATTKDGRLAVTQEDAGFLKFIISEYTQPSQPDYILPKPSGNCLILSPPLLPYESDLVEVARPPIPVAEPFNTQLSSSQEFWDRFPSLSPQFIDKLIQEPLNPSPPRVASKESEFIFNLKVEIPLTPDSTKKVSQTHDQHTLKGIASIIAPPATPRTPDSPEASPSRFLRTLETHLFNEQYSAAQSLRLQLPQLPPSSPRTSIFPSSLLGLFLAKESLNWHVIPQGELDVLNSEMKWLPFSKVSKTLDTWSEDVEGNWEDFVDYTRISEDDDSPLASRTSRQEEDLEHMEPSKFTSEEEEMDEFLGVIEEVRKRKPLSPNFPSEESGKRLKFAHTNRVAEYMRSQRGRSVELSDDEAPENIRILERNQAEQVYAAPIHVFQMNQNPVAPMNEIDPSTAVSAVILSTSILEHHYLTTFLRETLVKTTFFERDLTTNADGAVEGDIIVSANRCILFSTVSQITQTLPSNTSDRILGVAAKYRQVEILVLCPCSVKGKDVVQFLGWTEKVGNVRVVLANGEEAVKQWVLWLCLWRELDRSSYKDHLREDESDDELFLRRVFNVYNSQVILGRMTLAELLDLSHEMRVESFYDVASERRLKLLLDEL